jgi:small subunit ribosomal protein S16
VGAQPSEPVVAILSRTGDWQKFKGLPPPAEPLKVAPSRADRKAAYEVEAKAAAGLTETETKPKKETGRKAAKAAEPKPAEPKPAEPKPAEPKPAEPESAPSVETEVAAGEGAPAASAQESTDAGADAQG